MWSRYGFIKGLLCCGLVANCTKAALEPPSSSRLSQSDARSFVMRGVVKEIMENARTVVIQHEAVTGYMPAMTMPFKTQEAKELTGLRAGDLVSFRLRVTDTESWIDQITRTGVIPVEQRGLSTDPPATQKEAPRPRHPLLTFQF